MIKTIKTTKKLNLPELIHYVWEHKVFPSVWRNEESPGDGWTVQFYEDGMFRSYKGFHDYDTFTVEVEEEITEETEFFVLIGIYDEYRIFTAYSSRIKDVKDSRTEKIYALIDGELQLVWERGDEK